MSAASAPDLTAFSDAPPATAIDVLFVHHSVGGQWLADHGPLETTADARHSLHRTHPNGGGLRARLESHGYRVHEASYGSAIGQHTDLFDWLPKFRAHMPRVLATRIQDEVLEHGRNRVVMFKSCYPNNAFRPDGAAAIGAVPALTFANACAALTALRAELARHADTLFVYVTAPPLRDDSDTEPAWKALAKRLLSRETLHAERTRSAAIARRFNDWVTSPRGWLAGPPPRNLVVFDYFGLLAGDDGFLRYASDGGTDNHPSADAQSLVAAAFVPFLNRAVRYAGLED
jgi:hypothetical protein